MYQAPDGFPWETASTWDKILFVGLQTGFLIVALVIIGICAHWWVKLDPFGPKPKPPKPRKPRKPKTPVELQNLENLRNSCMSLIRDAPLKVIPIIAIEPESHLDKALAHYHSDTNLICFSEKYVKTASFASLTDTMKHELAHAWLHQYGFAQEDGHGSHFHVVATWLKLKL